MNDIFPRSTRALRSSNRGPATPEIVFRRLAGEFPLAFEAHQFLAKALSAQRAYPRALQEFDVAIRCAARESTLYFNAARTLADARQFDRAVAGAADGRRLDPASFYGAMTEGLVAQAAGHLDRAEQAFRNAIAINPTSPSAHLELGRLAERRGDRATALESIAARRRRCDAPGGAPRAGSVDGAAVMRKSIAAAGSPSPRRRAHSSGSAGRVR